MRKLAIAFSLLASPALATGLQIEVAGEANGTVTIDLFEDVAPQHVAQITALAEEGAYDGIVFHRVIDGFMAQTGDVEFGKIDGGDMRMAVEALSLHICGNKWASAAKEHREETGHRAGDRPRAAQECRWFGQNRPEDEEPDSHLDPAGLQLDNQ